MNKKLLANSEKAIRAALFLGAAKEQAELTGSTVLDGISPTDSKIVASELFIHAPISGGGSQHLLSGQTVQEKGITNFDGNRLGKGRVFVVDGVSFLYGVASEDDKPYAVNYSSHGVPPVVRASNLVVRQNNEVIVKLPVRGICNAQERTDGFYRDLDSFALLADQEEIEITLELPAGSTISLDSGKQAFVAVSLKGFETYKKR